MLAKPERKRGSRWHPETCFDKTQIVNLYGQGMSTRQVADTMGASKSLIASVLSGAMRSQTEAAILRQPATSKHWRSARAAARKVWERVYGHVPDGYHIHHVNKDYTDNRLENLECLTASEHARLHHPANPIPRHLRPGRQEYMRNYRRRKKEEIARAS